MGDDKYTDSKLGIFMDSIREQETGGLKDPWVRTSSDAGGVGSSAYGPYQVTKGLVDKFLRDDTIDFTSAEVSALAELSRQQAVSLAIGGSDRYKYADKYSREDLDRFDYGGTLALSDEQKSSLLTAHEKMLVRIVEESNGNFVEAARRWHGGNNHRNERPHVEYSDSVMKKFMKRSRVDEPRRALRSSIDKVLPQVGVSRL